MIFVDTSAWFATFVPNDANHEAANDFYQRANERFVTTDYVLDETLTLLVARGEHDRAVHFGDELLIGRLATLECVQPKDVEQAWIVFKSNPGLGWSFTDCVSRVIMTRLGIKQAFAFDVHFRQFGAVTVVP